jgi:hypothetical protein
LRIKEQETRLTLQEHHDDNDDDEKPTNCTISQFYFGIELYMFRTDLLSIIRSLNTVFTAIGICHTGYVDCLERSIPTSLADSQHNQYDKYLLL